MTSGILNINKPRGMTSFSVVSLVRRLTGAPRGTTQQEVAAALAGFAGQIQQLPPMYSALKHEGQPLYRYARAGKTVPRQERTVTIHRLDLLRFAPPLVEIELGGGRGAYVRTLAHDLGERLGWHPPPEPR